MGLDKSLRHFVFQLVCYNHIKDVRKHVCRDLYAWLAWSCLFAELSSHQIERDLPCCNSRLLRVLIRHQRPLREISEMRDRLKGQSDPLGQQKERFLSLVRC